MIKSLCDRIYVVLEREKQFICKVYLQETVLLSISHIKNSFILYNSSVTVNSRVICIVYLSLLP